MAGGGTVTPRTKRALTGILFAFNIAAAAIAGVVVL